MPIDLALRWGHILTDFGLLANRLPPLADGSDWPASKRIYRLA